MASLRACAAATRAEVKHRLSMQAGPARLARLGRLACLAPLLAAGACEDLSRPAEAPPPLSIDSMPRAPAPVASAAPAAESPAADIGDAGALLDDGAPHAARVTLCAIDIGGCRHASPSLPVPDGSYRVVFGRGAGLVRTRAQAMAELYKELRDRTEDGEHLEARPYHIGDPPPDLETAARRSPSRAGDEPLVEAAFQLMSAVDRDG